MWAPLLVVSAEIAIAGTAFAFAFAAITVSHAVTDSKFLPFHRSSSTHIVIYSAFDVDQSRRP